MIHFLIYLAKRISFERFENTRSVYGLEIYEIARLEKVAEYLIIVLFAVFFMYSNVFFQLSRKCSKLHLYKKS